MRERKRETERESERRDRPTNGGNPGKPTKTTRLNYAHELRGKHTVNRLEELKKNPFTDCSFVISNNKNEE